MRPTILFAIALGGALGALSRHGAVVLASHYAVDAWLATACINVLGSFVIGVAFLSLEARLRGDGRFRLADTPHEARLHAKGWLKAHDGSPEQHAARRDVLTLWAGFFVTGYLGGLTTFSSFSLHVVSLAHEGHTLAALTNVLGTTLGGMGAAFVGLHLASALFPHRKR